MPATARPRTTGRWQCSEEATDPHELPSLLRMQNCKKGHRILQLPLVWQSYSLTGMSPCSSPSSVALSILEATIIGPSSRSFERLAVLAAAPTVNLQTTWGAVKELKLSYHNPETMLFTIYP